MKGNRVDIIDSEARLGDGVLLPYRVFIDDTEILLVEQDGLELKIGDRNKGEPTIVTVRFMPAFVTIRGDRVE